MYSHDKKVDLSSIHIVYIGARASHKTQAVH